MAIEGCLLHFYVFLLLEEVDDCKVEKPEILVQFA